MRDTIRFIRKGRIVELNNVRPTDTLLDYLRLKERATGTKEGCGEGDCGACTVVIGTLKGDDIEYRPVNACIQLLGQVEGKEVIVVEDLVGRGGELHPVQSAMAESHATQCGFCTPGFVMALYALQRQNRSHIDRKDVTDWLAGNLCRCTGYRTIIDAALKVCATPAEDQLTTLQESTRNLLRMLHDGNHIFIGNQEEFLACPADIDALADLYQYHPDAVLVAGATDVGLWITKQLRDLKKIVFLHRVDGLDRVEMTEQGLLIGATATYTDVEPHMRAIDPDLGELWRRIGSQQVRASGTVVGNVANGSPIGDTPPVLIALDATLELRSGGDSRALPVEEFYFDYGRQDRGEGEFLAGLFVPGLAANQAFRCYKISKRFDQDISSVMAAFRFTLDGDTITEARIAFGGMAGIPKRAVGAEEALAGARLGDARSWSPALTAILSDFTPLSDHRASDWYRIETARNLLAKAIVEVGGANTSRTRVTGHREGAHVPV